MVRAGGQKVTVVADQPNAAMQFEMPRYQCRPAWTARAVTFAEAPTTWPNISSNRVTRSAHISLRIPNRSRIGARCSGMAPDFPARTIRPLASSSSR